MPQIVVAKKTAHILNLFFVKMKPNIEVPRKSLTGKVTNP